MSSELRKYFMIGTSVLIFSIFVLFSTFVIVGGLKEIKKVEKTVTVTGSAKKQIKSDLVIWRSGFSSQEAELSTAYVRLNESLTKVKEYLVKKGLEESDLTVLPISTSTNYIINPNGVSTNKIESYTLRQEIEVRSKEVEKITEISRRATDLINNGINFQSYAPQYIYTQIGGVKVDMLAQATQDAKSRAEQISQNAGSKLKGLKTAKMGVFQITPLYSTDVSDYGIYDTSSIEKEITGIVNCVFTVE